MGGENRRQRRAADAYRKAARDSAETKEPESRALPDRAHGDGEPSAFEKTTSIRPEREEPGDDTGSAGRRGFDAAPASPDGLTGSQRVAKLLIAMGPDRAAQVLLQLDGDQIDSIARAVILTPGVRREEARQLLEKIGELPDGRPGGGPDVAREMLVKAFGEERGEAIFRNAVPEPAPHHFDFMSDLEPHQVRSVLRDESAGAIAVIVPHLEQSTAADVLRDLPPDIRSQVVRHVARMGKLNREVVVRIEEAVREKIRRQGRQVTDRVDGNETLAAILRHMSPTEGAGILEAISLVDPDVSETIRKRLYTTDLLLAMDRRSLSDLFRDFTDAEIALFLKGKAEDLRVRVLRAVSERRREAIADEYTHMGPQRRSDVDEVTSLVMGRLQDLEESGAILVPREGDRYI